MLRFALAGSLVALFGGCSLYFDNHTPAPDAQECAEPAIPALVLVNPQDLVCQTFSSGGGCGCGVPCAPTTGVDIPTWGNCYSSCDQLGESDCLATDGCHVTRDWVSYWGNLPSFLGCYANDTSGPTTQAEPCAARGAEDCAADSSCTGLYQTLLTDCAGCGSDYAFQQCIPVAQIAGSCSGQVACELEPSCPSGTTPGISGNCYTGSCIPDAFCPPATPNG
jgi:hypothetical protein